MSWDIDLPWCDHSGNYDWCSVGGRNWFRSTYGKIGFKYGRIDFYVRLGEPSEYWPALWLLNLENGVQEVDVVEHMDKGLVFSQWWDYYPHKGRNRCIKRMRLRRKAVYDEIKYSLIWKKRYLVWLINDIPRFFSFSHIPDSYLYIIISDVDNISKIKLNYENLFINN